MAGMLRSSVLAALALIPGLMAAPAAATGPVSWRTQIQPIFEAKCVACHACYESPCQLNLGSGEGLLRGASTQGVYDGTRKESVTPTRLFVDARSVAEWRRQGFHSVLPAAAGEASLLGEMLALGRDAKFVPNARLPDDIALGETRQNSCPADAGGLAEFRKKHPLEGMPLGVTGLSDREYGLIETWLAQGAPVDALPRKATAGEQRQIAQWEGFLNQRGAREQLVARWLYEHLFIAHLYFDNLKQPGGPQFFELVRSRTAPGRDIDIIATAAPNDDPGGPVYYRFRPVQGTLVRKTHIIFALGPDKLERTRRQFFGRPWTLAALPGYSEEERANPFTTFAAVPALARYQFMLDRAEYFVRTFIRGPVCHGQIATDVIRDQFWALFQTPERDLFVSDAGYSAQAAPLLGLAGQKEGLLDLAPEWKKYRDDRNAYERLRAETYGRQQPGGAAFTDIWAGEGHNRNALLTIFRHFDSAAVRQGLLGDIPQTLWLMDYPLFERTYYGLVVNFNVFGSVSHQAQTRLYFDLIRNGAEMNFLRLLPPEARKPLLDDWYQGSGKLKAWLDYEKPDLVTPAAERYDTADPKAELANRVLRQLAPLNARPDPINRCLAGRYCARTGVPEFAQLADQALGRLASRPASELPLVNTLPELTLLRVHGPDGRREVYSLLRNRAHSNVAFMLGESLRYQPGRDTLTVYPGVHGSYPNFAFDVPAGQLQDFVTAMLAVRGDKDLTAVVERWGVRRTHPDFWALFHDFTSYQRETEPAEAGMLDMNRWQNL